MHFVVQHYSEPSEQFKSVLSDSVGLSRITVTSAIKIATNDKKLGDKKYRIIIPLETAILRKWDIKLFNSAIYEYYECIIILDINPNICNIIK